MTEHCGGFQQGEPQDVLLLQSRSFSLVCQELELNCILRRHNAVFALVVEHWTSSLFFLSLSPLSLSEGFIHESLSKKLGQSIPLELLLLHNERTQLCITHLSGMPHRWLQGEVFCPPRRRNLDRPTTWWRDYIFGLIWEHLGVSPEEL